MSVGIVQGGRGARRLHRVMPLGLAIVAGVGLAGARSLPQPAQADTKAKATSTGSAADGGASGNGRAAALYSPTGLTLLGSIVLIPADSGVCDTGNVPATKDGTTAAAGLPLCNLKVPAAPLLDLKVLTEKVVNDTTGHTTSSTSQVASVRLLPGGAGGKDLVHATLLTARTSAGCDPAATDGSATILTLSIAGQTVPIDNPHNVATDFGGLATVTVDYTRVDQSTAPPTQTASSVRIDFPTNGPLAALVKGTVFISYAKSQASCPAPPPSDCSEDTPGENGEPASSSDEEVGTGETPEHECSEEAAEQETTPPPPPPPTCHEDAPGTNGEPAAGTGAENETGETAADECREDSSPHEAADRSSASTPAPPQDTSGSDRAAPAGGAAALTGDAPRSAGAGSTPATSVQAMRALAGARVSSAAHGPVPLGLAALLIATGLVATLGRLRRRGAAPASEPDPDC